MISLEDVVESDDAMKGDDEEDNSAMVTAGAAAENEEEEEELVIEDANASDEVPRSEKEGDGTSASSSSRKEDDDQQKTKTIGDDEDTSRDDTEAEREDDDDDDDEEDGLPDDRVLDECSDEVLSARDMRLLRYWSYLIVGDKRDPSTWSIPVRDRRGRLNRPMLSRARQILTNQRTVAEMELVVTKSTLEHVKRLFQVAWPGIPSPKNLVRAVDDNRNAPSPSSSLGGDSSSSGSKKAMVEAIKSTAQVLEESEALKRRLGVFSSSSSSAGRGGGAVGEGAAKNTITAKVIKDEEEEEEEEPVSDVNPNVLMKLSARRRQLLLHSSARSSSSSSSAAGLRASSRNPMNVASSASNSMKLVRDKKSLLRHQLLNVAQSRLMAEKGMKDDAAKAVNERYGAVSGGAKKKTPLPAATTDIEEEEMEAARQDEGETKEEDGEEGDVEEANDDEEEEDELVVENAGVNVEAGKENSASSTGNTEDGPVEASSTADPDIPTEQKQPQETNRAPKKPSKYLEMLKREEQEAMNKRRRGGGSGAKGVVEAEASEEEDEGEGNYGKTDALRQLLLNPTTGGLDLNPNLRKPGATGGRNGGGDDDEQEETNIRLDESDLAAIVDTYSDDEGEGDGAVGELFHRQAEMQDEKNLKRLRKDLENHTLVERRRRMMRAAGLEGARGGKALREVESDEDEDEELELAREERYQASVQERLNAIENNKAGGGGKREKRRMEDTEEDVMRDKEQQENFKELVRQHKLANSASTLFPPHASGLSVSLTSATEASSTGKQRGISGMPKTTTPFASLMGDEERSVYLRECLRRSSSTVTTTSHLNISMASGPSSVTTSNRVPTPPLVSSTSVYAAPSTSAAVVPPNSNNHNNNLVSASQSFFMEDNNSQHAMMGNPRANPAPSSVVPSTGATVPTHHGSLFGASSSDSSSQHGFFSSGLTNSQHTRSNPPSFVQVAGGGNLSQSQHTRSSSTVANLGARKFVFSILGSTSNTNNNHNGSNANGDKETEAESPTSATSAAARRSVLGSLDPNASASNNHKRSRPSSTTSHLSSGSNTTISSHDGPGAKKKRVTPVSAGRVTPTLFMLDQSKNNRFATVGNMGGER